MKKNFSIILSVFILLSCNIITYAHKKTDSLNIISGKIVNNDQIDTIKYVDENGNDVTFTEGNHYQLNKISALPSSYDARNDNLVTAVKNQSPYGSCWAFSYCSVAESYLIKNGFETMDSVNLSESHLVWFCGKSYTKNSEIAVDGDGLNDSNPFDMGGNSYYADSTVARWSGFAKESDFPYSTNSNRMHYSNSDKYVSDYQLVSSKTIDYSEKDLKNNIYSNGSAVLDFCSYDEYYNNSSNGYCYYCPDYNGTNHAVTVIGWDDNFSASNFSDRPEGKGAWLCKNSWGEDWGDDGYFWISYHEPSLTTFTVLAVVPAGSYSKNYQYDGFTPFDLVYYNSPVVYMSNIFTAEENEKISSAAFTLINTVNYLASVSLYTDLKDDKDPTSGTLCDTQSVYCSDSGYYSIDFDTPYDVKENSKFSIVVTLDSGSKTTYIPVEGKSKTTIKFSSESGQSFVSENGKKWTDTHSSANNVPIKAFSIKDSNIKSISLYTNPGTMTYYTGQTFNPTGLSLKVTYNDDTSKIISKGFTISADCFDSVGSKKIVVSYGGEKAELYVDVLSMPDNVVKGIKLNNMSIKYRSSCPVDLIVDADENTEYKVTYRISDPYVVYIENGEAYGTGRGTTTVTCNVTDSFGNSYTDSCEVTTYYTFSQWLITILLFGWLWY